MTRKRIGICCLALFLLASLHAPAADQSALESQMRQLLKNNILALRMPYTSGDLKFDVQEKLIGTSDIGPWTIYSSVQITDVSVKDSSFDLDGERVILVLPKGKDSLFPMLTGRKVHISLKLTAPADEAKIRAAIVVHTTPQRLQAPWEYVTHTLYRFRYFLAIQCWAVLGWAEKDPTKACPPLTRGIRV